MNLLNSIENGLQITKAKEQVKRVFFSIKNEKQDYENGSKKHKRRESLTIDVDEVDDEPTLPLNTAGRIDERSEMDEDNMF
jgi:hypothetical protein